MCIAAGRGCLSVDPKPYGASFLRFILAPAPHRRTRRVFHPRSPVRSRPGDAGGVNHHRQSDTGGERHPRSCCGAAGGHRSCVGRVASCNSLSLPPVPFSVTWRGKKELTPGVIAWKSGGACSQYRMGGYMMRASEIGPLPACPEGTRLAIALRQCDEKRFPDDGGEPGVR